MAGVSESKAMSLHNQGAGFAKHLGVPQGSKRWNAIVYGTKRKGGWKPSTGAGDAHRRRGKK